MRDLLSVPAMRPPGSPRMRGSWQARIPEPRGSAPRERDHRGGDHPVPSRTRQLSPPSPRVLQREAAGGQGVALTEGAFLMRAGRGPRGGPPAGLFVGVFPSWLVVHPEAFYARGPVQWAMPSQRRRSHIVRLRARRGERNGGAHILCELFPRLDGSLAWIPLLLMLRLWLFDIVGRSVFLKRLLTALCASS